MGRRSNAEPPTDPARRAIWDGLRDINKSFMWLDEEANLGRAASHNWVVRGRPAKMPPERIERMHAAIQRYKGSMSPQDELEALRRQVSDLLIEKNRRADPARIEAWLNEDPRRPADEAFTAGPERQIAYLIELAEQRIRAELGDDMATLVPRRTVTLEDKARQLLKEMRALAKMTQADVGLLMDYEEKTAQGIISNFESGSNNRPLKLDIIEKFAEVCGFEVEIKYRKRQ